MSGARYTFKSNMRVVTLAQRLARNVALRTIGNVWLGKSTLLTPVDSGNLRASLRTDSTAAQVRLGSNVEYAPAVHENLTARHEVGQAKFIEAPLQQNAAAWAAFIAKTIGKAT